MATIPTKKIVDTDEFLTWLKMPLEKLGIVIAPFIRMEKFRFQSIRKDKNDEVLLRMVSFGVDVSPTRRGNQYRITWKAFTFMVYPTSGKILFYPHKGPGLMEGTIIVDLLRFLTRSQVDIPPGIGLSLGKAIDFIANDLELVYLELESPVLLDTQKVLPDQYTKIGTTEFEPVKHFGPATITHFVDASKNAKEIGTDGNPHEANDVQEILARPVRVVGNIRQIKSATLDLGLRFNDMNRSMTQTAITVLDQLGDLSKEIQFSHKWFQLNSKTNKENSDLLVEISDKFDQLGQDIGGFIAEQTANLVHPLQEIVREIRELMKDKP